MRIQTLGQERQASTLPSIELKREVLEIVVDALAETSGTGYERLEALAKQNPQLDGDLIRAPARPGELLALLEPFRAEGIDSPSPSTHLRPSWRRFEPSECRELGT